MLKERSYHLNFPPRHDFKSLQETGIKTNFPFGRTIITANVASHNDPRNENPKIDFSARENAVWLTYKKVIDGQAYDFIIGVDGEVSPIAVQWNNEVAEIFTEVDGEMRMIKGLERNERASFNAPENANTSFIYKRYPEQNLKEFYGIMRLNVNQNPGAGLITFPATFKPYIAKETLISGMKNRGLSIFSTSFWAVRMTDRSELPFGRELPRNK